jgi:glutamate 5-kinase
MVVKLGSGALTDVEEGLRGSTIRALAAQVARAWEERGIQCVVVTSGAVAAGRKKLGMREKPRTVALKQAAAAVGQTTLMYSYERAFEKRGRQVGQLLLTHDDFESRERYNNARNTVEALLARNIVPIINENDTVATEEIQVGDNDHLAALVTQMIGADLLILLTDNEGVFTRDPHRFPDAERIPIIGRIDEELLRVASTLRTQAMGTGGMASKLLAARVVCESGTPVVIGSGLNRRSIDDILAGKETGPEDVDRIRKTPTRHHRRGRRSRPGPPGRGKKPAARRGCLGAGEISPGRRGPHQRPKRTGVRPGDLGVDKQAGGEVQRKEKPGSPVPPR